MRALLSGARIDAMSSPIGVSAPGAGPSMQGEVSDAVPTAVRDERRADAWLHRLYATLALLALVPVATMLPLDALGQLAVALVLVAAAAVLIGAGLDGWGRQACAGLDVSIAPRVAARVLRLQAGCALLVLPALGAALAWLPAGPLAPAGLAAALAIALLAGTGPRWWYHAQARSAALRKPIVVAAIAALGVLATGLAAGPAVDVMLAAIAIALAWMPWCGLRILAGGRVAPADAARLPGALTVSPVAVLRAGLPLLLRRVAMLATLALPVMAAALGSGAAIAGVAFVVEAGVLVAAAGIAGIVRR